MRKGAVEVLGVLYLLRPAVWDSRIKRSLARLPGSKEVEIIGLLTKARELVADRESDGKRQAARESAAADAAESLPASILPEDMDEEELNAAFLKMRRDSLESLFSSAASTERYGVDRQHSITIQKVMILPTGQNGRPLLTEIVYVILQ